MRPDALRNGSPSAARPRILAIAPWIPSVQRPRSFGLLDMLSRSADVRLVGVGFDGQDEKAAGQLSYPAQVVPFRRTAAIVRALSALPTTASLQQEYMNARAVRRAIKVAEHEFQPHIVYFNTLRSAQWLRSTVTARRVIDLDEFRSDYYRQVARSAHGAKRVVASIEAPRMVEAERDVLRDFDTVLVSSPSDLRSDLRNVRLVRSPHQMTSSGEDVHRARSPWPELVFVGRMSYDANVRAVTWFVGEVLPLVQQMVPSVRLRIVGMAPTSDVRRLASENVEVCGSVESVEPYYRAAWISVIPVTEATGVQMKLIESLSCGTPVVTTPLVAMQAGLRPRHEALVAETAADWAEAVTDLLLDPHAREALGNCGRAWVRDTYATELIEKSLLDALALHGPGVDRDA